MAAKVKERFAQKVAEGNDHQNASERDEGFANAQPNQEQRAPKELDERNRYSHRPERPNRQEGIGKRQEVFSGVLERAELKDLPETGHEKDQAENEPGEEHSPTTLPLNAHYLACTLGAGSLEAAEAVGEGLGATLLLRTLLNCGLFSCHW